MPTNSEEPVSVDSDGDDLYQELFQQARAVLETEPELCSLLHHTVLHKSVKTFEDAVAQTVCYRLLLSNTHNKCFCPDTLQTLLRSTMQSDALEYRHTMKEAVRNDCLAVVRRDPAMNSVLEVVLFSKGFCALVCHRTAYRIFAIKKFTALFLQSQCSAVFGVDLHPLSQIGQSIMFDHATGIVVGETATIGDGCTLLHGVTLGGTGKDSGDRHPKIGKNVLIGANASILGNISVGEGSKIGAGSVVLRPIPKFATAVGAPAKIIGRVVESKAGSEIDETLQNVSLLHPSKSMAVLLQKSTSSATVSTVTDSDSDTNNNNNNSDQVCPYRMYAEMAKKAPKTAITLVTLYDLLHPLGLSMNEIGAFLFALDTKNVGYIYRDVLEEKGVDALTETTSLDREAAERFLKMYLERGRQPSAAEESGIGVSI